MAQLAECTTAIALTAPYDLRASIGGRIIATAAGVETWRAARTPDGLASVRIRCDRERVVADAWGPGAAWLLASIPALLGLDTEAAPFVAHHDVVRRLHRDFPGLRLGRTGLVWPVLARTILGQKVTTLEATRGWQSLRRAFGERAPGPVPLLIDPAPERIAALPYYVLHEHGIERKRADILIGCARVAAHLQTVVDLPIAAGYERLMAVPGVGIWTASGVMGEAVGDPDAIPIGDYHVPNTVSWALEGRARGNDARMIELLEPYRGHRRRVVRLLHLGHVRAPRRGPRLAPRDIRGW